MSLALKTKGIIEHFKFKFNKNLGQNFLIDENILLKTVDSLNLDENTCVIEIGPGIGTLTHSIAEKCKKVIAIEIDQTLIPILDETLGNYKNVKIINNDVLRVDFKKLIADEELENVNIAANLPYYVTTPVITKLFTEKLKIQSIVLMVQKEAYDRISAKPNTDEYGYISVMSQYYSNIEKICKVPPSSFIPQPRVESVVIKMNIKQTPDFNVEDEKLFFRIIKESFIMRRKTLWNALKQLGINEEKLKESFESSKIDSKRRGETLSIEEFALLANQIRHRM